MRQRRFGTPELAVVAVLALLVAGALLLGGGKAEPTRTVVSPERLARVERGVEQIRGLRFKRPVSVEVMTADEARAYAERETDGDARQAVATGGELMMLLGLVEPGYDFDSLAADLFGEQVAGFYDPVEERLVLVEGVGIDDGTLAHELTHALEDQHYDLERLGDADGVVYDGDGAVGESGLVEGTAMLVMTRYLERNPGAVSFGEAFGQLLSASAARPLPEAIMRSLTFPYLAGERFVRRLYGTTGDWRLVDVALRDRPPASSAELLDADRWLRAVRPERVPVPAADAPGAGWRRISQSTFGENDLRELLRDPLDERPAGRLAAGWAGGTVVLWRRGPLPAADCAAPCRARDALALRLRLDSARAARRLRSALETWIAVTLDGAGVDADEVISRVGQDGLVQVGGSGREVRVAMAPDAAVLERLLR
ncbi:hypothetical protein [Conexibacter arvalis]|uniref:Uncharacterized protein n=1 Tax=Conexibacter arvalis TaxID=912552 RepID=A0A840IG69_9ACTN|nr:hypothetical protein [Conexibacter arvalis]MBB4663335.1 hypothetical protein [Conexibacter arvalis]